MSRRLDQEREARLEPSRADHAEKTLSELGYNVTRIYHSEGKAISLRFMFKGAIVTYWPYSGWASGRTIKDGRGFKNLLKQIEL